MNDPQVAAIIVLLVMTMTLLLVTIALLVNDELNARRNR